MPAPLSPYFCFNLYNIMKLHLPTRLRAAVLACFAVVTSFSTTLATGAIAGGAFAVTVAALVAPQAEAASYLVSQGSDAYFHNATFTSDEDGTSRQWGHFSVDANGVSQPGREDILHFGQSSTEAVKFLIQFSHFAFGGLQVDAGTLVTGIGSAGSRTFYFGKDEGTFNSNIYSDFTLESSSATYIHGTHNWFVAKDKTFTLGATSGIGTGASKFGDSYAAVITQSGPGTVNFSSRSYSGSYKLQSGNLINANFSFGTFSFLGDGTAATVGDVQFNSGVDISALRLGRLQTDIDANCIVRIRKNTAVTFGGNVRVELGLDKIQEGQTNSLADGIEYRVFSNEGNISGWTELSTENFIAGGKELPCNLGVQTTQRGLILVRRISPIVGADDDGVQHFEWNDADAIWKKNRNNAAETAVATNENSSVLFDASAEVTVEKDGVVIRELVVCGGETEDGSSDAHPGETNVSLLGGFLKATNGIVVQEGAKLEIKSDGGRMGSIRSDGLTIKKDSVVQFSASNVTGYDVADESVRTINIESGGTLLLSNYGTGTSNRYERFVGTLNLNGSILDDTEQPGLSRLDLYGGSASLTSVNGLVTAGLHLAQNNTTFSIHGRLTLNGMLSGADDVAANLNLAKSGGDSVNEFVWDINGEIRNVGIIQIQNNMSTVNFNGGGNFDQLDFRKNNIHANFSGEEQFDIGYINLSNGKHVKDNNNRGRLITIDLGTEVNLGKNAEGVSLNSSWGTNMRINGVLNTAGEFLLSDGSEDVIEGGGTINAASFKAKNAGNYRFLISEFNVEGQTRLERGITIESGTFNMKGAISSDNNGSVTVKKAGNLYISAENAPGNVNIQNLIMEDNGGQVYVESGKEDVVASVTIANTKQLKVINNDNGLVTLTGTINIVDEPDNDKANATRTESTVFYERVLDPVESATESDNGYRADQRHYRVVTNGENLSFGANAIGQVNGDGTNVILEVNERGHVHQRYRFDPTTYWVNVGDVEYASDMDVYEPATHIRLSGGLMQGKEPATLTLTTNLKEGVYLDISEGSVTTLHLEDGVELNYDQLDFDIGVGTIVLTGSGRYVQPGGSVDFKVTTESLRDADNWTGTVVLGGEVDELDINRIGNVNSTVELCGNYGTMKPNAEVNVNVHLVNWEDDYNADVVYPALDIRGEENGDTTTFNREVFGSGDMQSSGSTDRTIVFAGEVTDWVGNFVSTSTATTTVKFTGDDVINVSLNHNSDASRVLDVILDNSAADVLVMNGNINASSLKVVAGTTADIAGDVSLTGKLTIEENSDVLLRSVSSKIAEAEVNGSLTLVSQTEFGTVKAGTNGSLVMDLTQVSELENLKNWDGGPLMKIDTLSSTTGTDINIEALANDRLLLTLRGGESVVLAEINDCTADLNLRVSNGEKVGDKIVVLDSTKYRYDYELVRLEEENKTLVVLTYERTILGWNGKDDDKWLADDIVDQDKWVDAGYEGDPYLDPYAGAIGYFSGNGLSTVEVEDGGVRTDMLIVSVIDSNEEYTLKGGSVLVDGGVAGAAGADLVVNSGSLIIDNAKVDVKGDVLVSSSSADSSPYLSSLTVNTELNVDGDMGLIVVADSDSTEVAGTKFSNSGVTTVAGKLAIDKDVEVNNSGILSVGSISATGVTITNTDTLIVGAGGGTIGALEGNAALENRGDLSIEADTTLTSLLNIGKLDLKDKKLTVHSDIALGGEVVAGAAVLEDAAFTGLTIAGEVKAGNLEVDNGSMGSLDADSLTSLTAGKVTVTNDATLETFNVNGQFIVGGKLTATDTVVTGGKVAAAGAELTDAAFDTLSVTGTVKAEDLTVKTAEIGVLDANSLTVVENGTALVKTSTTLGAFDNLGTVNIDGDLTVNSDVVNGGSVVADNITVQGDSNFAQVNTGTLQTDAATIAEGAITTLSTDKLTVNGGTVSVKDDVTLSLLDGAGKLQVDDKVTLTDTTDCAVDVTARTIELATSGNTLGEVTVDTITMAEGILLNETDVVLATDAISSRYADAIAIDVSDSAFAALSRDESGRYTEADYLILSGADADDVFVNKNVQQMQDIRRMGACANMLVNGDVLTLRISAITDENGNVVDMFWDTTGGNTLANNGYEIISGGAGFYKSLDYAQQVIVTDDRTFDLSTGAVGDSISGNASEPLAGLLVRNLRGGGTLTVKGNSSAVDTATFFNTDGKPTTAEEAVGLTADAATVNLGLPKGSNGYLVEDAGSEAPTLASLRLVNSAQVNVNNSAEVLGDTDLQGFSRLYVMEGSTLTTRTLTGTSEAEIKGDIVVMKGGKYTGTYDEARITAKSGSNLSLRTGGCRGLGLTAEDGTTITLDSAGQHGSMTYLRAGANPMMRLAGNASTTINVLNATKTENGYEHSTVTVTSESGNYINKSTLTLSLGIAETARTLGTPGAPVVFDGAVNVTDSNIVVNLLGDTVKNGALDMGSGEEKNLTLAYIVSDGEVENNKVTFAATPELEKLMSKYYTNMRLESDGAIRVDRVADFYSSELKLSDNAQVGIDMADAALVKLTPQGDRENYKDLAGVLDTLDAVIASGDTAAAEELGAAVSGASIAALGVAVAGDVERQLMAIRNRTTTMGVDQSQVNESMPYFNAWINAEGDFRRLDADKSLPGYELNSWGGTVGFDVDVTPRLTMGMAATAMYGDFTAESADKAEGDLDTYYVTAFARYAANRWSHTFVATVGTADTSLQRTVTHANGNYTAEGSGDAVSFGFMYEVGYVVAMNESATACLQPVFNVMLAHSSLDGYSEEKSDAALRTNGVDMTTVTFGMGARTQAIVGENLYNRASMVEARALVKVRAGDREGETENALDAVPNAMGKVTTAEMGTVGAEFGVGLTVPMGATGGSVFADASVEISSGYTNINGTVGYRINF